MAKVIIAGGGTGGHIFPAIAIANALQEKNPSVEILFVGAKGKMEMEKIPQAGYNIKGLDIAGFNRSSLIKNLSLPFKLIKSFLQVRTIINEFKPDAVVGVGGYSSFPVLKFAQRKGIPTFIHESNSFAGKSNILLGKSATAIFVATEGMNRFFPADKIVVSGNPVRKNIISSNITRSEAIDFFGLDKQKKTILIVGGSLGAQSINNAVKKHLAELSTLNAQLIWQTGKSVSKEQVDAFKAKDVWAGEFIKEMDKAYAAADVVISRAGAMAVTEIIVTKKPAVFVPYPHAAEDHQTANAKFLVDRNAALMVADKDVDASLFSVMKKLVLDEAMRQTFIQNIAAFETTNADEIIANEILKHIK